MRRVSLQRHLGWGVVQPASARCNWADVSPQLPRRHCLEQGLRPPPVGLCAVPRLARSRSRVRRAASSSESLWKNYTNQLYFIPRAWKLDTMDVEELFGFSCEAFLVFGRPGLQDFCEIIIGGFFSR